MAEDDSFELTVTSLVEQNTRSREQFARTRAVAERLWELWTGEAAALLGAEWELADGRARALFDEELAIIALLPAEYVPDPEPEDARQAIAKNPRGEPWSEPELLHLLNHAVDHFSAQQEELQAGLAGREELIGGTEGTSREADLYAKEHRLWAMRAKDVVERLSKLRAGTLAAFKTYLKAGRINTRMFQADLFADPAAEPEGASGATKEPSGDNTEQLPGFFGQLGPSGLFALADSLVDATERLLKALIAAELALEDLGPLVGKRWREWAQDYDQRSQEAFVAAGDCLRALSLITRSVRQAGRNWEIAEFNAGGGRGMLPEAAKVKEITELRIAPPPSAIEKGKPRSDALERAEAAWRTLAEAVDTLDKAVVAVGGFDSAEADALESAVARIAARLRHLQDEAAALADICAERIRRRRRLFFG